MALFSKKKKTDVAVEATVKKAAPAKETKVAAAVTNKNSVAPAFVPGNFLLRPRITEKAAVLGDLNVVVFEVNPKSTERDIKAAVMAIYKVMPKKVRFVRMRSKAVMTRNTGRIGRTKGGKKAYVQLKSGDKIELI